MVHVFSGIPLCQSVGTCVGRMTMVSVILSTYENVVLGLVMIDLNYEYQLAIPFFSLEGNHHRVNH